MFGFSFAAIGPYLIGALLVIGGASWLVHDIKAPLQREITALRRASEQKEAMLAADAERAEHDRHAEALERAELEKLIDENRNSPSVCRLSAGERDRLQQLAAGKR